MNKQAPYIIYADDDSDDLAMLEETLKGTTGVNAMLCFKNGNEVIKYLSGLPAGAILPNLIILDMNMPGFSGLDTLEAIKKAPAYSSIPVYIFTNSDYEAHRAASTRKGAIGFITKPFYYQELKNVCQAFAAYLLHHVKTKQL